VPGLHNQPLICRRNSATCCSRFSPAGIVREDCGGIQLIGCGETVARLAFKLSDCRRFGGCPIGAECSAELLIAARANTLRWVFTGPPKPKLSLADRSCLIRKSLGGFLLMS